MSLLASMLNCGDTFLTGTDDDEDDYHLWIIVTPTAIGEVVTVCVCTAHKRSERLVVLNQGDHPFIKHESVVSYQWSTIRQVVDIEAAINTGAAKKRESVTPALLKKIQDCVIESDFTPNGVRHFFRAIMGL